MRQTPSRPLAAARVPLLAAALSVPLAVASQPAQTPGRDGPASAAPRIELQVTLDPAAGRIEGRATLRLDAMLTDEPVLDLNRTLEVESVEIDGRAARFRTSIDGSRQLITVLHPGDLDGVHEFTVRYAGALGPSETAKPAEPGGAALGPRLAFLTPDARWYPEVVGFEGPSDVRLAVRLPRGWQVAAAAASPATGPRRETTHRASAPGSRVPLVAGPWRRHGGEHGPMEVYAYLAGDDGEREAQAKSYMAIAGRHLAHYAKRIGAYGAERFSIVEVPFGVAHRTPGLAALQRHELEDPATLERRLAHDVAHGWWGDGVLVDPSRGDWSEGLVAYLAEHRLAAAKSDEAAASVRRETCAAAERRRDAPASSSAVAPERALMVFHMLERRIGGERFEQTLREVYGERRGRRAGWESWQRAFSRVAGEDLGWFFRQWLYRTDVPRLSLAEVDARWIEPDVDRPDRPGRRTGEVYVQIVGTILQDAEPFRVRVPLVIESGERVYRRSVEVETARARFRVEVPRFPDAVKLDPDHDLLRSPDPPGSEPPRIRFSGNRNAGSDVH